MATGRTAKSLIVICENFAGQFYFKRFGLQTGLSVEVSNVVFDGYRSIVASKSVRYSVSPGALVIQNEAGAVTEEPMLEYWSV